MIETLLYVLVFLGVLAGLGFWIVKARSAMKSVGRSDVNNEQNMPPPSTGN